MATRLEKVVLDIESNLAPVMIRDAGAAALLRRELNSLSTNAVRGTSRDVDTLGTSTNRTGKEIDRFSGRLRLLADTAAILGPALVPIGAMAIPAIAGLAAQFGAAALAGGTALIAFQGVGDALKAVNDAALEPTTENLEKARLAMGRLAPEAQSFVRELQSMRPAFGALQAAAAAGIFPGLERALGEAEGAFGRVERVLFAVGDAAGDVAAEFAEGIAGPRGQEFLAFIKNEVPDALVEMGRTVGNLVGGLAELWMAFTPLNRDFSGWLLDISRSFDDWAQGLSQTQGFQEFIDYIRTNGPKVADALGSIGNAVLKIVEAAAPLGGPVLEALAAVADVIAAVAGSDAGPAIMATVTALALLNRGMRTFEAVSATSWGTAIKGADGFAAKMQAARWGRGVAAMAGLAVASSDLADGFALSNTVSMALMGTLAGPWGAAVGGAVGLLLDASAASGRFEVSSDDLAATLNKQTGEITRNTTAWAANQLEKQGVLAAAQDLGLNLEDVTKAALGNADAIDRVTAAMAAAKSELYDAQGVPIVGTEELLDFKDSLFLVEDGISGTNEALGVAQSRFDRVTEATGRTKQSFEQATSAAQQFRDAVEQINRLLEKRSSVRDYEAAIDDLTKSIKDNGRTLDVNTGKGRANQAAMDGIIASAIKVAEGMRGTNQVEFLKRARADFVDAAAKLLGSERAARNLWDRLVVLDKVRAAPEVEIDGWAVAVTNVTKVQSSLNNLRDRTVYVDVVRRDSSGGVLIGGGQTPRDGRVAVPRTSGQTSTPAPTTSPLTSGRLRLVEESEAAAVGLGRVAEVSDKAAQATENDSDQRERATEKELRQRERLLTKELEHAEKVMQAELDYLREIKDARRELAAATAGNFMTGLFGDIDLVAAIKSGDLFPSEVTQEVRDYAAANGLQDASMDEQIQAYLDSLSAAQLEALQGQATAGMLAQDTRDAEQFAALLQQLQDLGFDGGMFQELAASGNIGAAQYYATLTPEQIDALEQAYAERNAAAQSAGAQAAKDLNDEVRKQRKVAEQARDELRDVKRSLYRVEDRLEEIEKNTDDAPRKTGKATADALNGAVATAQRRIS